MNLNEVRHFLSMDHGIEDSSIWVLFWSLGLALAWLLPNHYVPWAAFHVDAWVAWFFFLAALSLAILAKQQFPLHRTVMFIFACALIPPLQYFFGLLPYAGMAWIDSAYIMGFACSIMLGAAWEKHNSNEAIDSLFLSIGVASVVSVGLQLYQWLQLDIETFYLWILYSPSSRPYANLIQPNQLATLLMWGLIATAWGAETRRLRPAFAVFLTLFLLLGVALTQSRTAFLAVMLATPITFLMRRFGITKYTVLTVAGLSIFYFVVVFMLPYLSSALFMEFGPGITERNSGSHRIAAYKMLFSAVLNSPWVGYGWSQTALAQLSVANNHPAMGGIFMQSHNLFLDLLVWCGVPLGLLMTLVIIYWFLTQFINLASTKNTLLLAFIAMVGWHSMLELPLHYAYFLLPTGLVVGTLCQKTNPFKVISVHRNYALSIFLCAGLVLGCITRDYFRIEEGFTILRFERAKIGSSPTPVDGQILMLDQMEAFIEMGRVHPKKGMSESELNAMRQAAMAYPSLGNFFTLLLALAWNDHVDEAQNLVLKLPNITSVEEYINMRKIWMNAATNDIDIARIHWTTQHPFQVAIKAPKK